MSALTTFRHQRSRLYRRANRLRLLLGDLAEDQVWIRKARAGTKAEWLAQRIAELLESADTPRRLRLVEAAIGAIAACTARLEGVRRRLEPELRNRIDGLLVSIYEDLCVRREQLHQILLGRAPVLEPLGPQSPQGLPEHESQIEDESASPRGVAASQAEQPEPRPARSESVVPAEAEQAEPSSLHPGRRASKPRRAPTKDADHPSSLAT